MLTTPNYSLFILIMFGNVFQKHLFHHFPRNQDRAVGPVIAPNLLLALLDDRSGVC